MGYAQPVITQQMVIAELIKAGINRDIAADLSFRYYHNELTYKDIEYLKENFDIKLKHLEDKLSNIKDDSDSKIDTVENNLNIKIDIVRNELKSDIAFISNEISLVRKDMEINKIELKKDISNLEKNNKWIFSLTFALWLTILGGFIALILK